MAIYMETTNIEADETVAHIQRVLGRYGASAVMTEYQGGQISALTFKVNVKGIDLPFRLPCRDEAIYRILGSKVKRFKDDTETKLRAQAKRIAWRQILRWIEAQMALVETSMVDIHEVFFPYLQIDFKGNTIFHKFQTSGFKALEFKDSKSKYGEDNS